MVNVSNAVIVNCFDTYEHRVKLLKDVLQADGYQVTVVTSNFKHVQKTVRPDCPEGFELLPVRPYRKNMSADRLMSHYRFAKDAIARVEEIRPNLLWVLIPPNALVKFSAAYKKRNPEVRLVLDFIDMWPETMPISTIKSLPPFSFWKGLRDRYVDTGDVIVTECDLYQPLLEKHCSPEKLSTVYLARSITPLRSTPCPPEDHISLCYLGSINNIIDIPCIAEIIKKIEQPVELHIIGDGEKREELIQAAKDVGAQVHFHGTVYDAEEKQRIFDRCHFGLNIMKDSVYVGLTMKSMDYFEASLPIINNIKGDTWEFVKKHPIGINYERGACFTPEAIQKVQIERPAVRVFFETYFSEKIFSEQVRKIMKQIMEA